MATVREEIAKNLLFYRKQAKLTQKELAEKLGVKNTAVSNWESGNNSIDIETLILACKIFDVTINDMFGQYSQKQEPVLSEEEAAVISSMRHLNGEGRDKVIEFAELLDKSGKYSDQPKTEELVNAS